MVYLLAESFVGNSVEVFFFWGNILECGSKTFVVIIPLKVLKVTESFGLC